MEKYWILGLFLAFSKLNAGNEIQQLKNDTLNYSTFSDEQRTLWNTVFSDWKTTHFNPFLKKEKIKLSCAHCESVYVHVVFDVYDDGHAHIKITSTKKCGETFNAKQLAEIEKLLWQIDFPGSFNGKIIKITIGEALKC